MYFDGADFESDFELENRPGTPAELISAADEASRKLLPSKSSKRYIQVYDEFEQWKKDKNTTSNSERVFLPFFTELAEKKKLKASSLWAKLSVYAKVDISS